MARRAPVQAQPAAPPRVGLVPQARVVNERDERWVGGFAYQPEGCAEAGTVDPCASGSKTISDNAANVEFEPFGVWAGYKCSAHGDIEQDWRGRAERALEACTSKQVEAEFWTGEIAQAMDAAPNRYLASGDSDVLTDGAVPVNDALACLEQGLAECGCGSRGMIHATRQIVTLWQAGGALRRDGNQILTVNDTIVVPGAGYDGSGPDGQPAADGSVWAYATSLVDVRLSSIDVLPSNASGLDALMRGALHRGENTVEVRAERLAAATWDGCCHFAVEIDASLCGFGGPGS